MIRKYNVVIDLDVNSITMVLGYVDNKTVRILDSVSTNIQVFENGYIKNLDNIIKNIYLLSDVIKKDLNLNEKINPVSCAIVFSSINSSYISYKTTIYTDINDQKVFTSNIISKGINDFKHKAKPKDPNKKICSYVPYLFNLDLNGVSYAKTTRVYPLNEVGDGAEVFFHCTYIDNGLANQFDTLVDRLDFSNINFFSGPFIRQHYIYATNPFDIGNEYFMLNVGKNYSDISYATKNAIRNTEIIDLGLLNIFLNVCNDLNIDFNMFDKIISNYGLINNLKIDFKIPEVNIQYSLFKDTMEKRIKEYCDKINEIVNKTTSSLKSSNLFSSIIVSGDLYLFNGLFESMKRYISLETVSCETKVPGVKMNNNLSVLGSFLCLADLNWQKRSEDVEITRTRTISMASLRKNTED